VIYRFKIHLKICYFQRLFIRKKFVKMGLQHLHLT